MKTFTRVNAGFSLIELMIAMVIGLILLSATAMIFVSSSESNRELQKTSQQIENGRYAMEILSQDLRMAGFYGHLQDPSAVPVPSALIDPCEATDPAELQKSLWFPIQAYRGTIHTSSPSGDTPPDISATSCAALAAPNLKGGSDVLVLRRADTNALAATDTAINNVFYIQANPSQGQLQIGNGAVISTNRADGDPSTIFISNGASPAPPAPIRRFHVRIYFVAPCSVGGGTGGVCTGAAGEDTIPTLKRMELDTVGNMKITPLVEGIDYLKVEYGIDDAPTAVSLATGYSGNGTVDRYVASPSVAEWTSVVSAKVFVLARNTEATRGYSDTKTYTLGSSAVPSRGDAFKRHVYSAAVQLVNPAGRREIP
jgi:type IV pilus assembly protein PilW